MKRAQKLAEELQQTHVNHFERVRNGDNHRDDVATLLKQMVRAQHCIPTRSGVPFLDVTAGLRQRWKHDLETLESVLGSPLRPGDDAMPIDSEGAQSVLVLLAGWMHQLEDSDREWSFMEMMILVKQLYCIDQLLSAAPPDEHAPYQVVELEATLLRFLTHQSVWSFALRLPCKSVEKLRPQMIRRAVEGFFQAAQMAAPNLLEQARLLIEQCKMLEPMGLLLKAQGLESIELVYPDALFAVLNELHDRYKEAGATLTRSDVEQQDGEVRDWQSRIDELESRAAQLDDQEDAVAGADADRLRVEAANLRHLEPRAFEQAMNRSQAFFHPDKRKTDLTTSAEEKSAQFAQVKETWSQLVAYRSRFQVLRAYSAKRASM